MKHCKWVHECTMSCRVIMSWKLWRNVNIINYTYIAKCSNCTLYVINLKQWICRVLYYILHILSRGDYWEKGIAREVLPELGHQKMKLIYCNSNNDQKMILKIFIEFFFFELISMFLTWFISDHKSINISTFSDYFTYL